MPRRKSLTRRLIQHLLLISLARTILTALGRGRAWDEWDERKLATEPAEPRKHKRRFAQTLSFSAIFFAGLALSAGAGNGVYSLLEADGTTPAASGATGASGPSGPTGATGKTADSEPALRVVAAAPQAAPVVRPTATPATRVVVKAAGTAVARPLATSTATTKKVTAVKTRVARPSQTRPTRPQAKPKHKAPAPKAPALDPETAAFPSATVWLNRAAPDPTPPAARLKLSFARQLVRDSRAAHVDWALVLATLRAQGHNDRVPATASALHALAFKLSGFGGRNNAWMAALSATSDTSLADRVVALRHYYRAVGLASLVNGLLSQKADLQDRVLHDQRLTIYPGGRQDVAKGRVDVRVLSLLLYLAETYHQVTVSCLISGHRLYARPGHISAHIYGRAVDVAALDKTTIYGHQQPGGITEQAVRSILMLPGGMLPAQVISLFGMGGPSFALANHYDHIHVGY
jgi:hypothetical protein